MNLRDLHYIVAVAEHGHFGRAAAACNVSQPTLSGQILKLEDELQIQIFERVGKSVRPTRIGDAMLAHARQAVAAAAQIRALAQASRDPLVGPIRLGIIPTLAPYIMAYVLARTSVELPAAPLVLIEEFTHSLLDRLQAGDLDAALIATEPPSDALEQLPLFDDPFLLVVPAGHPLEHRRRIRIADIDPRSLLLLADGHCLRDQALDLCGTERDPISSTDVRASSLETLLHLVAAGYGVTLVPLLMWQASGRLHQNLVAHRIDGSPARRRIRMVWRAGLPRRAAIQTLARIVSNCTPACGENILTMRREGH